MATRNFPQQGVVITPQQDPITAGIAFNFDKSNTNGNLTIVDLPPTHGLIPDVTPLATVKVMVPSGGATLTTFCDDYSYFPDYVYTGDEQDYIDYLSSLGSFTVDWGDETINEYQYTDGYSNGFTHTYSTEGEYYINWYSPYVFLGNSIVSNIIKLQSIKTLSLDQSIITDMSIINGSDTLQYVNFSYNTSLTNAPVFSNMKSLKVIDMQGCSSLETLPLFANLPLFQSLLISFVNISTYPDLSGLHLKELALNNWVNVTTPPEVSNMTTLEVLYLDGNTLMETPPDITNLTSLKYLSLSDCTSIDLSGIDELLSRFSVLRPTIEIVNIKNGITPTPAIKDAAIAANPQCTFMTD